MVVIVWIIAVMIVGWSINLMLKKEKNYQEKARNEWFPTY